MARTLRVSARERSVLPLACVLIADLFALAGCGSAAKSPSSTGFREDIAQICAREEHAADLIVQPASRTPAAARAYIEQRLGAAAPDIEVLQHTHPPSAIRTEFNITISAARQEAAQLATAIGQPPTSRAATSSPVGAPTLPELGNQVSTDWETLGLPTCARMLNIPADLFTLAQTSTVGAPSPTRKKRTDHRTG